MDPEKRILTDDQLLEKCTGDEEWPKCAMCKESVPVIDSQRVHLQVDDKWHNLPTTQTHTYFFSADYITAHPGKNVDIVVEKDCGSLADSIGFHLCSKCDVIFWEEVVQLMDKHGIAPTHF